MNRAPSRGHAGALLGSASVCFSSFIPGAHAQEGRAPEELAEALENTSERIDAVGGELARIWERAIELLPLIALGLGTVLVFWLIAHLLTRSDLLFRWIDNRFARDLVRHFARILVIGAGILLALELLDAAALVGAALGAAGVVGIAVGFAFRDIIENYLAGLLLSMRRPFEPNDFVSIDGDEGKVVRLTSRATVLLTLAGNHLRIPNAKVFKAVLVNYTQNPFRRIDFEVGVGSDADLATAQRVGVDALSATPAIIDDPLPMGLVEKLGDSTITLHFYAWLDQRDTDFFKVRSEAIRIVKSAFDDAGIDMPAPSYQISLATGEERAAPQAVHSPTRELQMGDTAADVRLDEQVESERAAQGPDFLDDDAPRE